MPTITTPWTNEPLGSMETWLCWQNQAGLPLVDPAEYVEWYAAQGLNWMRLFSWQRGDYRPFWSSNQWWHRLDRYVRLTREAGIYLTPSLCQGCNHTGFAADDLAGAEELSVAHDAVTRYGEEPNIIWEFGNELPLESHENGTVQQGIDILRQTGQPVLWAPSESVGLAWDGFPDHVSLYGWTDGDGGQTDLAHIVDHVQADLRTGQTTTMIATIEQAADECAIAFAGLGWWRNKDGHNFGLPSWGNQGALADWNRPAVLAAIREHFLSDAPAPPVPAPDPSRYEALARAINDRNKFGSAQPWNWDHWSDEAQARYVERVARVEAARGGVQGANQRVNSEGSRR